MWLETVPETNWAWCALGPKTVGSRIERCRVADPCTQPAHKMESLARSGNCPTSPSQELMLRTLMLWSPASSDRDSWRLPRFTVCSLTLDLLAASSFRAVDMPGLLNDPLAETTLTPGCRIIGPSATVVFQRSEYPAVVADRQGTGAPAPGRTSCSHLPKSAENRPAQPGRARHS